MKILLLLFLLNQPTTLPCHVYDPATGDEYTIRLKGQAPPVFGPAVPGKLQLHVQGEKKIRTINQVGA